MFVGGGCPLLLYTVDIEEVISMEKDFTNWHKIKVVSQSRKESPTFQERDIWWSHLGANIGDEEDGKGKNFSRPILIIRKFNKKIFWAVPLTTQLKDKTHYHKVTFKDKVQCIMLTQLKLLDSKRLMNKMGSLSKEQCKEIREKIKYLL